MMYRKQIWVDEYHLLTLLPETKKTKKNIVSWKDPLPLIITIHTCTYSRWILAQNISNGIHRITAYKRTFRSLNKINLDIQAKKHKFAIMYQLISWDLTITQLILGNWKIVITFCFFFVLSLQSHTTNVSFSPKET